MSYDFSGFEQTLTEAQGWLKKEYNQISAGRANPAILDSVMVESYGAMTPIKNIASVGLEDARTLRISPWDKSQIDAIQKAIQKTGMPLSTAPDSDGIRAQVPIVTEENKKQLVKLIKDKMEDARVTVRRARQDADKGIESTDMSDDEKRGAKDEMQKLVETANSDLEAIFKKKETDVMSV